MSWRLRTGTIGYARLAHPKARQRVLTLATAALAVSATAAWAQMATADRVQGPGFWPTKGTPARTDFVGPSACATCHGNQAKTQPTTSMARTASRAADSAVLRAHHLLTFRSGSLHYEIATRDGQSLYSVSDGTRSSSVPLAWAFGAGKVGQTYLFEKDGTFQESRLSYFDTIGAAGFTPTRAVRHLRDLDEALSRPLQQPELGRCFGCHTTASTTEGRFDPAVLMPGVTCEACHGPGRKHVAAAEGGRFEEARAAILDPGKLDPIDLVDFCGACHATFWDVKLAGEAGIAALRSQPHRLQSSRCWNGGDPRLTCVGCHDPHRPLVREAQAYDERCLGCHVRAGAVAAGDHRGPPCKAGKQESCTTCHMPKYDVPDMHFRFTDHLIRVVEAKQ